MSLTDFTEEDTPSSNSAQAPAYMGGLNTAQRDAVNHIDGPLLVLAGAGTGKTRVLTTRLAHILHSRKAFPGQILAVTFTNKAASEMKERVSHLLGGAPVEGWWLGTFHALCARMLRRHADLVGLSSDFTIIDTDDQIRLIKQLMEADNIDTKKWQPKVIAGIISRFKDQGKTPAQVTADDTGDVAGGKLKGLYAKYQERLRVVNAADFGDLLLHMLTIFQKPEHKDVLEGYHHQFKYLLVDEYQDTNVAQYLWLRLLAQGSKNLCCVGDDDQSIYGWRGAEVGNILRFEQDFPGAKIVRLEQNYRSTGNILKCADAVIAHNENRLGKTLWADAPDGDKIKIQGLWDGQAEARWVGEQIERLHSQIREATGRKYNLNDMAVLVRAGFQTRAFEERFINIGLPYRVIGGPRFYERKEIRDALAYFRVVMQPDDDLALERIINTPKRGLGDTTIQRLQTHARASGISLYRAILDLLDTDEIKPKPRGTIANLLRDFSRWRGQLSEVHHCELAKLVLDESGYTEMWQKDTNPDSPGRLENLKELVSAMEEFETMAAFMEHVALVMENDANSSADMITIMTLHGAKGLEFPAVFLPGWEEGLFPSQRSMDETGLKGLEEERRLAYVGITRAREKAFISHAANRLMYGNWINAIPSRFIDELPEDAVTIEAEDGMYGGGRSQHWDSSGTMSHRQSSGHTSFVPRAKTNPLVDSGEGGLRPGSRVRHKSFGEGVVILQDGNKLDIQFDRQGRKRVLSSFIEEV